MIGPRDRRTMRHMLRCVAAAGMLVVTLFVINCVSLVLSPKNFSIFLYPPSGSIEDVEPNSKGTTDKKNAKYSSQKGIISAAFKSIGNLLSPEGWTAVSTVIMAGFTGMLSFVAYRQIVLSRSEFLAANRPILRVRYFRQTAGTHDQVQIRFAVVNAGRSPAHLLGSSVVICFANPDSLGPPVYAGGQDVVIPRKFEVGASDDYVALGSGKGMEIRNNENFGRYLFVYGYLAYSDDSGNTRTTAFGRRYLSSRERFVKIEDDDYEYED